VVALGPNESIIRERNQHRLGDFNFSGALRGNPIPPGSEIYANPLAVDVGEIPLSTQSLLKITERDHSIILVELSRISSPAPSRFAKGPLRAPSQQRGNDLRIVETFEPPAQVAVS
jgi:hypothetical protein